MGKCILSSSYSVQKKSWNIAQVENVTQVVAEMSIPQLSNPSNTQRETNQPVKSQSCSDSGWRAKVLFSSISSQQINAVTHIPRQGRLTQEITHCHGPALDRWNKHILSKQLNCHYQCSLVPAPASPTLSRSPVKGAGLRHDAGCRGSWGRWQPPPATPSLWARGSKCSLSLLGSFICETDCKQPFPGGFNVHSLIREKPTLKGDTELSAISEECLSFFFNAWVPAKSLQWCLILCEPRDCSPSGSPVHGFSRWEHWSALPCPPPGDLHWQVGSLPPGKRCPGSPSSSKRVSISSWPSDSFEWCSQSQVLSRQGGTTEQSGIGDAPRAKMQAK